MRSAPYRTDGGFRSPGSRRRRAAAITPVLAAAASAAAVTGCDPCDGVVGCQQAPRLGVSGQIVDRGNPSDANRDPLSGAGIPPTPGVRGVQVEVVPRGGVAVGASRAVAVTDATGWWQVSMPAEAEGDVRVDVTVTPPGRDGYTVRGLDVRASRRRGHGNVLGRWTRDLYLTLVGEVYSAAPFGPVDGARVTAVRSGGVAIEPTANTRPVTFGGGRFIFDARPLADGPVRLDFTIERDGFPNAVLRGIEVWPKYEWLPPNVDGVVVFVLDAAGRRVN